MDDLHERFATALREGKHAPLLLSGAYVFDFLMIHPFNDGNGRMSRLLTLLLLYHAGYEIGRFIGLERLVEESEETYCERASRGRLLDGTGTSTTSGRGSTTSLESSTPPTRNSKLERAS